MIYAGSASWHTPPLSWHPSKEGTRYTRPKAYHGVDDDGSRDVSPLDILNPLQRGTPIGGGEAKRGEATYACCPFRNQSLHAPCSLIGAKSWRYTATHSSVEGPRHLPSKQRERRNSCSKEKRKGRSRKKAAPIYVVFKSDYCTSVTRRTGKP